MLQTIPDYQRIGFGVTEAGSQLLANVLTGIYHDETEINVAAHLFPSGIDRFTHQERRVCPSAGMEFLGPAVVDLGEVKISFLVYAHSVHIP